MQGRKYPQVDLSSAEFEKLLALVDALDPIQLLRLQCKVNSLIGDPEEDGPTAVRQDIATLPPPAGLAGVYKDVELEEIVEDDESE
jgi:hypothetical protein